MRRLWVLAALLSMAAVMACGQRGTSPAGNGSGMSVSVRSTHDAHAVVGLLYTSNFDIKNTGKADIPRLDLVFDGRDRFLNYNQIVESNPCTVDWTLPGFACGDLPVGDESVFSVTYEPKGAGNFTYEFEVANDHSYLPDSDGTVYTYSWTQSVQGSA